MICAQSITHSGWFTKAKTKQSPLTLQSGLKEENCFSVFPFGMLVLEDLYCFKISSGFLACRVTPEMLEKDALFQKRLSPTQI